MFELASWVQRNHKANLEIQEESTILSARVMNCEKTQLATSVFQRGERGLQNEVFGSCTG